MHSSIRSRRLISAAAVLGLVAALGACRADSATQAQAKAPAPTGLRIAMITEWDSGSFWSVVKSGAEQAAKNEGATLIYSTADGDPQKEAQLISAAVTLKVDGIAVSAADPDAIKAPLKKAEAAGIPVITLNSGGDRSAALGALGHVGQTELIAGQQAGRRLAAAGAKKLLCVDDDPGNIGEVQRCQGAQQGFGNRSEVVDVTGVSDVATTLTEIESKLRADPSVDAVLTLNPDVAIAARDAIKAAGSSARLATFDLSPDVLTAIQQGQLLFAVDQQPYLQGYLPVVMLSLYRYNASLIGGGSPILTGPSFVTADNVAAVRKYVGEGTR
ncbi:MAG TPA: substrate-binding domain-containing protein [Actinospica sp.]|jgi:simple sugar transport system substrate-binding protein|nr:substrate-binding domain-containing protein [Actinospica sp.]